MLKPHTWGNFSILWLLMPWLLTSPDHQQPWCWLCRTKKVLLSNDDWFWIYVLSQCWEIMQVCLCMRVCVCVFNSTRKCLSNGTPSLGVLQYQCYLFQSYAYLTDILFHSPVKSMWQWRVFIPIKHSEVLDYIMRFVQIGKMSCWHGIGKYFSVCSLMWITLEKRLNYRCHLNISNQLNIRHLIRNQKHIFF